jgi:hypothetical protein
MFEDIVLTILTGIMVFFIIAIWAVAFSPDKHKK